MTADESDEADALEAGTLVEESDTTRRAALWCSLALIHGYNALIGKVETLGHRIGCRMGRDAAVKRYRELGGEIRIDESEKRIAFLGPIDVPSVNLYPRDIELMRKAIAQHDALEAATNGAPIELETEDETGERDAVRGDLAVALALLRETEWRARRRRASPHAYFATARSRARTRTTNTTVATCPSASSRCSFASGGIGLDRLARSDAAHRQPCRQARPAAPVLRLRLREVGDRASRARTRAPARADQRRTARRNRMKNVDLEFAGQAFAHSYTGHYQARVEVVGETVIVRADVDDGRVVTVASAVFLRLAVTGSDRTRSGIAKAFADADLPVPNLDRLVADGVLEIVRANDEDGPWYVIKKV